jgi:Ca2+-binding EF-hand superfamily protein
LAERIFYKIDYNFSGFMNWEEFLEGMKMIRAKTLEDKIKLFISLADKDGNGLLSYDEVLELSVVCLSKFFEPDDEYLQIMAQYFTRLIFESCGYDMDDEIPLERIKQRIIEKHPNASLLCMFCGADV